MQVELSAIAFVSVSSSWAREPKPCRGICTAVRIQSHELAKVGAGRHEKDQQEVCFDGGSAKFGAIRPNCGRAHML